MRDQRSYLVPESHALAAARLARNLAAVKRWRAATHGDDVTKEAILRLKAWQSERLAATYPDLLASPRYRAAAHFFMEDLYGPKDFSQRDADVERILPKLTALLPAAALSTLADAVELDELSEELDAKVLAAHGKGVISHLSYATAYADAATPDQRRRQIALIRSIGEALEGLTRIPLLLSTLKLMRGPARMAGLSALQVFLEKGFVTVKEMRGVEEFLAIITRRETVLMERLFARAANPFAGLAETG